MISMIDNMFFFKMRIVYFWTIKYRTMTMYLCKVNGFVYFVQGKYKHEEKKKVLIALKFAYQSINLAFKECLDIFTVKQDKITD